jgi:hypothetical protein
MKPIYFLLSPVALVALALVVVLLLGVSPLVALYFVFDRLCGLIEELKPAKARKAKARRGEWMKRIPSLLKPLTIGAKSSH